MAKRKAAANRGRSERAAKPSKPAGRTVSSKTPAGKAVGKRPVARSPAVKPGRGKPAGPKTTNHHSVARKIAAQKQRADRRPSEAEAIQDPRQGPDTGSVSAKKNGRKMVTPDVEAQVQPAPIRKTPLSEADLAEFRELLLAKRRELVGDMNNMADEARRTGTPGGTMSSMPIHMADLGSDTWEQELTLGLIENERNLLREIDEALARINNKTYGICIATNKPIGKARLRFKPWAKYCIEHARKVEQGRG